MSGGIDSQYGFLFQKYVYILMLLKHMSMDACFTYEGIDDIDIEKEEPLHSIIISQKSFIQVKSGNINQKCMIKVIVNWLNMRFDYPDIQLTLFMEHDLNFNYKSAEFIKQVIENIKTGETKKKSSILRTAYDKYSRELNRVSFEKKIMSLLNEASTQVMPIKKLEDNIFTLFKECYCGDIKIFELAKKKRQERLISCVSFEIDKNIKEKKPYKLRFDNFMVFIQKIYDEITDTKYTIDIPATKKKFQPDAEKIVSECTLREVEQLSYVNEETPFIVKGIIQKLIYKDLRDVYENSIEISNIEDEARDNYDDVVFELINGEDTPWNRYHGTINKQIKNELFSGSIYSKGCYIYLTSEEVSEDLKISWSGKHEK
mgnify:CR=1 FL=1